MTLNLQSPVRIEDIPWIADLLPDGLNEFDEKDLASLGVELCIDARKIKELKGDLKSNEISPRVAFAKLLKEWVEMNEGNGEEPRMERLVEVLNSEGLTSVADELQRVQFSPESSSNEDD